MVETKKINLKNISKYKSVKYHRYGHGDEVGLNFLETKT